MLLIQHSRLIQRYIQIPTDNEVVNIKNKKEQTFKWLTNLVITLFNDKRVILKNKMSNHLLHLLCYEESAVCGIRHLFCHKKKQILREIFANIHYHQCITGKQRIAHTCMRDSSNLTCLQWKSWIWIWKRTPWWIFECLLLHFSFCYISLVIRNT